MMERPRNDGYPAVKSTDTDFIGAMAALRRAAANARRRAFDTIGSVAIVEDGRVVWQRADGTFVDELEEAHSKEDSHV